MDQDATWYGVRPQPRRLYVRRGRSPLLKMWAEPPPQFSAYFRCGQTAACIKISLGMEVGLSPGDFVLDGEMGTQLPPQKWGGAPQIVLDRVPALRERGTSSPSFRTMFIEVGLSPVVSCGHGRPSQLLLIYCLTFISKSFATPNS